MDEDGGVEDTVGVEVEVLDHIVSKHPLQEVACREFKSALYKPCEHQDLVGVFLHGVPIPDGDTPQVHLLIEELVVDEGEEISVFSFAFVHSFAGLGEVEWGDND
jgi:hypothetical protein